MKRFAFAVLLVLLLAGCAKEGPAKVEPAAQVSSETGIIRGVVLDTTITPVAGANITIDGYDVSTIANPAGQFAFAGLAPGSYFLTATHPDFHAGKTTVGVVANVEEPEIVKIALQPKLNFTPFADPFEFKGFLQCSYRVVLVANNCPEGNSEVTYEIAQIPEWVQSTLQWDSGSPLGDELSFDFTVPGTTVDYLEVEGPSPLTIVAPPNEIKDNGIGNGLDLYLRVFTSDVEGTEVPGQWGVGFQFDQDFTIYTHIFYGFQPDDGWNFLDDGAPEP